MIFREPSVGWILATKRLSKMRKELEAAAAEGFEFRGVAMKRKLKPFSYSSETIVVMERPVGETKRRFDYKLISTKSGKTAQKELDAAVSEGYFPEDMVMHESTEILFRSVSPSLSDRITIVLARDANNPGAEVGAREYRFLRTDKVSTMEKEMNQLAKEGFQFHIASIGSITIMTRLLKEKTQKYEYKLLATQRTGAMQKELTEMGLQGYRFLGASTRGNDLISFGGGLVSVMERGVGEVSRRQYEYKFLATTRESTTQKELSEALASGYKFIEISSIYERLIVLGRIKEATAETK